MSPNAKSLLCLSICILVAVPVLAVDSDKWREDLSYLTAQIKEIHPDPYSSIDEERFDALARELHDAIPQFEEYEIVVEFQRLVALLKDGHSGIQTATAGAGFDTEYPVVIYPFEDGVYITSTAPAYSEYVGARVVRIGEIPIKEAIEAVSQVINGENSFTILDRVPRFLALPGLLAALDLSDSIEQAEITVANAGGSESTFQVSSVPHRDFSVHGIEAITDGAVHARKSDAPLYLKDPHRNYWFEHIADQNLVYVQFNRVRNGENESFADFCHRMFAFVDENAVEALVLDIRFNHGGNNQLLKPLIHGLIRRDQGINQERRFYTIIGRGTFSAAISCTGWLEEHTNVRFVGEPAGSGPNHWGDAERVVLPNSGINFWISEWAWQTRLPWDSRQWFAPDVPAPPTFEAYVTGRDLALEAVTRDRTETSLAEIIHRHAVEGDFDGLTVAYRDYKATHPDRWQTSEAEVNEIGYDLLNDENTNLAIAVFALNVESYPQSANCYDSLAEAYLKSGDRTKAIELYRKALEVDPRFASSIQMLSHLGVGAEDDPQTH